MNYFIIDHPNQIELLIGFIKKNKFKKEYCTLLVSNHKYHTTAYLKEIKPFFNDIKIYRRVNYGRNIISDFYNFLNTYLMCKFLEVRQNDAFFCFSFCQNLENTLVSLYKNNDRKLFINEYTYSKFHETNVSEFIESMQSKFFRVIHKIFKIHPIYFGKHKDFLNKSVDGTYILKYQKSPFLIYNEINIFSTNNINKINSKERIIKPAYFKRECTKKNKSQIIFFGNCFLQFDNVSPKEFIIGTNSILEYLERKYPVTDFKLIYFKHPRESHEVDFLNLDNFSIVESIFNAENYILKNLCNIDSIHTITSTILNFSYNLGLNSFSYYKLMGYNNFHQKRIRNLYKNIPKDCFPNKL